MIVSRPRRPIEHLGCLLQRARVQLDEQVHDDLVLLVLVEAHVREELPHPVLAEGRIGEGVAGLRPGADLHVVGLDGHRARGNPRRAGDHPLPAVLDRLHAPAGEAEVRLVVHAVQALHHRLLQLVDDFRALPGFRVDLWMPS